MSFIAKNKVVISLLFILFLASFFRLWQLDKIPPGLYPDVAMNGNDALGGLKVFYSDNNGREGLMMWLIALSFSVFGISIFSIKVVAALIGILTVFGLYLLTKELLKRISGYNYELVALLSSFFLAISFWHVNFSRIGFRAILLPFVLVFAFYFLFRGFSRKKILDIIISGIFFGLGFYTYTSYRMVVLLLPLIFLCWPFYQGRKKEFLLSIFYFLITIVIIALPLVVYFFQNPQDFISRAAPISVFNQEQPIQAFFVSLLKHLAMFNIYGDPNWRHNFAGSPMLFWPVGILFLIGFVASVRYLINSLKTRSHSLLMVPGILLPWFFVMLLPGVLTYEGLPHSLRTIGVIPAVYIFAGLGGLLFYQWFERNTKSKKLLFSAVLILFLMMAVVEYNKYFIQWAKNPEVKKAFTQDYAEIGNYLNSLPPETKKYVIVNELDHPLYGISIPGQTPMFIEATKFGGPVSIYLKAEELDKIKIEGKTVVVPIYDGKLMEKLMEMFPEGVSKREDNFSVFIINKP